MSDEHRQAIDERKALIEARARALASNALASAEPWTSRATASPSNEHDRTTWLEVFATVAAYRDRYEVISDRPVGRRAGSDAQRADRRHALGALRQAEGPDAAAANQIAPAVLRP